MIYYMFNVYMHIDIDILMLFMLLYDLMIIGKEKYP